jgi:uncharacterized membrane protein YkgB
MIPLLNDILAIFSAVSFIGFGSACFWSPYMKREFRRYHLGAWRPLIGALQLGASAGLLAGLSQPWMGRAAAAGLAMMMLTGVCVRIKIKDSLMQTLPALFYMALNAYLCVAGF